MLKEELICTACDGTGAIDRLRVSCINCGGDGKLKNGANCAKCSGRGEAGPEGTQCFDCGGAGTVVREKWGPEEYRASLLKVRQNQKGKTWKHPPGLKRNRGPNKKQPPNDK